MSAIDEIKQRLDIYSVVGSYVNLQPSGRNFKGACPFHQEKTPSFFVFPERQSWKCFGCGAGGDLISFVMKKEGIEFSDALKMLADRAGVSLSPKKDTAEAKAVESLYQINEAAAQYYHSVLLTEPIAEQARNYIRERDISQEAIADFQLGFSPADGLKKHLLERGCKEEDLVATGLLRERDGRLYEFFRGRLMIPIMDVKGRFVGFGARALDDSVPKYLNSPQTAIFDKSGVLYGIHRAKAAIREKQLAVVVEGYMDVITAHQHGEANVVASMGTALTEKQIRVIGGLTRNLAFALDPDVAGDAATLRGIEICRKSLERQAVRKPYSEFPDYAEPSYLGTQVALRAAIKIITLPKGKDPDELIRENPQAWQRLVDQALPLVDPLIDVISSRTDLSRPEGKSRASEQLLPIIAELEDDVEREFYLGKLASLLEISERRLAEMAARIHRPRKSKFARTESQASVPVYYGDPLEERCLSLLLQHPELRDKAEGLLTEHFERSENREVFLAWRDTSNLGESLQRISVELTDHLETLAGRVAPPGGMSEWEAELAVCIRRLEEKRLRNLKIQEESFLADAESEGRIESISALQQKGVEINLRLKEAFETAGDTTSTNRGNQ